MLTKLVGQKPEIAASDERPIVYVIDDEPILHELARRTAESLELDVQCFASGQQFFDVYDASRIGCLVTDLRMPELTGQDILEILAAKRARLPTIMISGHGDIPAAVRAMEAGAIGFLEKPCSIESLREGIRKAIELARKVHREAAQTIVIRDQMALLTDQEQVTMQMIAGGKPDKAIASTLGVSIRTVQLRRASVMKKLRVKSRAELIRVAPSEIDHLAGVD
jgi:two-component system response regulator FixJ